MILRHTHDGIRVAIEEGYVYLGFARMNSRPLTPTQAAVFAGIVSVCDAAEIGAAVNAARSEETPGAAAARVEKIRESARIRS